MPIYPDPTPGWLKAWLNPAPEPDQGQAHRGSNTTSWQDVFRSLAKAAGVEDPQSQVLGLMAPLQTPAKAAARVLTKKPTISFKAIKAGDDMGPFISGEDVSNMGSLESSLDRGYVVEPGLQSVPLSDLGDRPLSYSVSEAKRTAELSQTIRESRRMDPLIVVRGPDGAYVLEGQHRLGAAHELQASNVPAVVVRESGMPLSGGRAIKDLPPIDEREIVDMLPSQYRASGGGSQNARGIVTDIREAIGAGDISSPSEYLATFHVDPSLASAYLRASQLMAPLQTPAKAAAEVLTKRLYRVEANDLGDQGEWLKKHLTPEQYDSFRSERGRLFSDDLSNAADYGHGVAGHTTYTVDAPSELAETYARVNVGGGKGAIEYLLPADLVATKQPFQTPAKAAAEVLTNKTANNVRSFATPEGNFSAYDTLGAPELAKARRGPMFTVHESPDGFVVRNALVPDELQRQGIASRAYSDINARSLEATGNPLRSTGPRTLMTGETVHEMTPDAVSMWDSFVDRGLATKLGDKNYAFVRPSFTPAKAAAEVLTNRVANPIKAYHGSPHDFAPEPGAPMGRFRSENIGTGEGAQAYGHGLYFAENEGVAAGYKEALSPGNNPLMGTYRYDPSGTSMYGGKPTELTTLGVEDLARRTIGDDGAAQIRAALKLHQEGGEVALSGPAGSLWDRLKLPERGRTYEVNIHADPADFLDWDAPLSQQSARVKGEIDKGLEARGVWSKDEHTLTDSYGRQYDKTGGGAYNAMSHMDRGDAYTSVGREVDDIAATRQLAGIPGIKYLDQGSRAAGEGTSNYVVFDASTIEILRKYGVSLPVIEGLRRQAEENDGIADLTGVGPSTEHIARRNVEAS